METYNDHLRKLTGYATINYNQGSQVCFFQVSSNSAARAAAKKLISAGFTAVVSGLDRKMLIVDLFNNMQSKP